MPTPNASGPAKQGGQGRLWATLRALLRTRLSTGLLTVLPVLVTLWVVRFIFGLMRDASQWVVEAFLLSPAGQPYLERLHFDFSRWERLSEVAANAQELFFELLPRHVRWGIALLSVLLTIFSLYVVGLLAANFLGRRVIRWVEQMVARVPLVKTIYRGAQQILVSFAGDQTRSFQRVALIAFPQERMRCIGFITNVFKDSLTGEELCMVFIATTPNPTTGYLQIVRRCEVTELDWSVEEAISTIMSGGIIKPDFLTIVPGANLAVDAPVPAAGAAPATTVGPAAPDDAGATVRPQNVDA